MVELTCLLQVPMSDLRELSSTCSGPLHKPPVSSWACFSAELSCYAPVQWLKPQRWQATIRGAHVQIVSKPRVSALESQCTCSSARATMVASCNLRVAMDLFEGSNHNGDEQWSRVPMSRFSLSQGPAHLSHNVHVQWLKPQRWRAAIRGAHVQIVSEPRVSAHESQCAYSSAQATTVASFDQECPCPDCLWAKGQRTWVAMYLLEEWFQWLDFSPIGFVVQNFYDPTWCKSLMLYCPLPSSYGRT